MNTDLFLNALCESVKIRIIRVPKLGFLIIRQAAAPKWLSIRINKKG
jgi:hypothetical protein